MTDSAILIHFTTLEENTCVVIAIPASQLVIHANVSWTLDG